MSGSLSSFRNVIAKIPFRIILAWIALALFGYYVTLPSLSSSKDLETYPYSFNTQSALINDHAKVLMPQAIVFIAMGELARVSLVHDAISAVRLVGHWNDKIVILTDRPSCFNEFTTSTSGTFTIAVEGKSSIIEIKKMKTEVFSYLPKDIDRILYMDVDILITRNIGFFLQDLTHLLYLKQQHVVNKHKSFQSKTAEILTAVTTRRLGEIKPELSSTKPLIQMKSDNITASATTIAPMEMFPFDFAAFLDAGAHYVGFCSGCEKWHTGVLYLQRNSGQNCLKAWGEILTSGKFNTDQQSLDYAESLGNCSKGVAIPSRHLLFAKDYIGMVLTSGQTFIHLTAANRADTQDAFYTNFIIPRIRNSLHPPLKPYDPKAAMKICSN
jgi:hypothetical protein